ncbi:MAG: hypothetical protein V9G09_05815 [Candidatus Nanopelagicales bacterium]
MSFKDLPPDWPDIPLTDPTHIADVLDIFVSMKTRMNGGLLVLLCDPLRRPMQPILVEDFGRRPPEDGDQALKNMATSIAEVRPRGHGSVCDRAPWRAEHHRRRPGVAHRHHAGVRGHVPLIGVHVVTPDGSRLVHPHERRGVRAGSKYVDDSQPTQALDLGTGVGESTGGGVARPVIVQPMYRTSNGSTRLQRLPGRAQSSRQSNP